MNGPVLVLCLLSLALLGSLPLVFFRAGRKNARWWITAAPFLCDSVFVLLALAGLLTPVQAPAALQHAAVTALASAIALTCLTLGTHVRPIALWHQHDDAPVEIVRHGAYRRIRHPFYAAFILMLAGAAFALPHPLTALMLLLGTLQLDATAAREERRLLASALGAEYAAYMRYTGRFLPRLLP